MPADSVHLNGRIVPAGQAAVSVFDAALMHGASVFTTMLARNGTVFRLDRHLARLMETAARMNLRTEATADGLASATRELLEANGLKEARLRITLSPGSTHGEEDSATTTLITADPLAGNPSRWYNQGIRVIVSSFRQFRGDPLGGFKTGCYLPRVLARREAAAKGAEESIWYTQDNYLAEACFCNVFLVLGGKVLTPPLETPVLAGIVRQAVLELCATLGVDCDERTSLTIHQMLAAEEMFLTSSISGIRSVIAVEKHDVGDGKPGPLTQRLMASYEELLNKECGQAGGMQGAER
jgi:branched-chain amino acid aminotransferase